MKTGRLLFWGALFGIACLRAGVAVSMDMALGKQRTMQKVSEKEKVCLEQVSEGMGTDERYSQGVSALFAGVSGNCLLMAGGANFPDIPAAQGGSKCYYQEIYTTSLEDTVLSWHKVGRLPVPAAYGFSVSTDDGIVCVGGMNAQGALSSVFRISMENDGRVKIEQFPSLPCTLDNMSGCLAGQKLYVVGGNRDGKPCNAFYMLDLECLSDGWVELSSFPGKPRIQPVCAAQKDTGGEYTIYLWGGFAPAAAGKEASLSTDGYRYSPSRKEWIPLPAPVNACGETVSLGGGVAVAMGDSLIVCMGGVHKDVFLQALRNPAPDYLSHPAEWYRFNRELLVYHTSLQEWYSVYDSSVLARAGAVAVPYKHMIFYINGEIKPGVRTPSIVRIGSIPEL